jgi:hypothetical protein
MAGSGSLFGVMRRGGGPQALRGLLPGVGRAVDEQGVAGIPRAVEESRSGWGEERAVVVAVVVVSDDGGGGGGVVGRREVECQEGVVPRAVCAVAGDAGVADGASEQGRRRWWSGQRCSDEEGRGCVVWRGSRGRIEGEDMQLGEERGKATMAMGLSDGSAGEESQAGQP